MDFNIILIGPPCSGKGTHSNLIAKEFGLMHVSTGELFRREMEIETPMGILAKMLINNGNLVPDSITLKMLYKHIQQNKNVKGFLLDGVPRTLPQAELIKKYISKHNIRCDVVFYLHAPEDILFKRMQKRAKDGRADDTEFSFFKRMLNYYDLTHVLTEYYMAKGKLIPISTDAPIKEVSEKIFKSINHYLSKL